MKRRSDSLQYTAFFQFIRITFDARIPTIHVFVCHVGGYRDANKVDRQGVYKSQNYWKYWNFVDVAGKFL